VNKIEKMINQYFKEKRLGYNPKLTYRDCVRCLREYYINTRERVSYLYGSEEDQNAIIYYDFIILYNYMSMGRIICKHELEHIIGW